MISAPWLHHSTGETPGGLMENCTAVRLPICTAVRGGHGRVSKTAARVMTPKVNSKCHAACAPLVLLPHDNGPLWAQKVTRALFFDRGGGHDQRAVVAPQHW